MEGSRGMIYFGSVSVIYPLDTQTRRPVVGVWGWESESESAARAAAVSTHCGQSEIPEFDCDQKQTILDCSTPPLSTRIKTSVCLVSSLQHCLKAGGHPPGSTPGGKRAST